MHSDFIMPKLLNIKRYIERPIPALSSLLLVVPSPLSLTGYLPLSCSGPQNLTPVLPSLFVTACRKASARAPRRLLIKLDINNALGNGKGWHSIRINDQWRICFRWRDNDAHDVEIVDYH